MILISEKTEDESMISHSSQQSIYAKSTSTNKHKKQKNTHTQSTNHSFNFFQPADNEVQITGEQNRPTNSL